jgi:hypothetical protein
MMLLLRLAFLAFNHILHLLGGSPVGIRLVSSVSSGVFVLSEPFLQIMEINCNVFGRWCPWSYNRVQWDLCRVAAISPLLFSEPSTFDGPIVLL